MKIGKPRWNGEELTWAAFRKKKPIGNGTPSVAIGAAKPQESLGLGCHRVQVEEFNKYYAENGINGAYHKPDGTCVLESRQARNAVLKLRGLRDNDAGYGDWAGIH